jgi:hyperosmotically inducible periplasmic protein
MRLALCGLTVLALALAPAVSTAQATADAPKPGTGSVMKDSWITTKAKSSLVFDKRVAARRVKVETYAGVITLRGKVSSVEERNAAEEVARDISGVTAVTNALQVVPDDQRKVVEAKDEGIEKAVKGRLEKDASLKDAGISVRSDNSVVTLMGTAPDRKSKAHASDVVRSVPGVRAIRNELAQKD